MTIENSNPLYLGIDGGGTHCRVRLESADGTLLGAGQGGSANPACGLTTVVNSITTAINMALVQAGLGKDSFKNMVVGAGLAGLHLPKYLAIMSTWQHPFKAIYFTDDLIAAALGAHNGQDGAVVIVGTGFSALANVNGKKTALGGHGFLMADHCSGSWIGYQAVQAALLADDGLAEQTQLSQLLHDKFNGSGLLLADALVNATAKDYGAIAPLVFHAAENQDKVANDILKQSADFICQVVKALMKSNPPRLSLVGGIVAKITSRLDPEIVNLISPPIQSAEQGAIHFARSEYKRAYVEINSKVRQTHY